MFTDGRAACYSLHVMCVSLSEGVAINTILFFFLTYSTWSQCENAKQEQKAACLYFAATRSFFGRFERFNFS